MVLILYYIKYLIGTFLYIETVDEYMEKLITQYYRLFPKMKSGVQNRGARRKVIISLTTIPDRIDKVWLTIESLLRQTYKPDEIILWLAEDEFKNKDIPERLNKQMKRGLRIRYCDNVKSYKKFYFTVSENPEAYVVTVDDDVIYAENLLQSLVRVYKQNPGCIICTRSHRIRKRNAKLLPYNKWDKYNERNKISVEPKFQNFFVGCGGILIPMFLMDQERLLDRDIFMDIAPTADDVWLNFNAWVCGLKVKNVNGILGTLISISSSSKKGLSRLNVNKNKNDEQIRRVIAYLDIDINHYIH